MRAIRAKYENGAITPIEPLPELESPEVLVILADKPKDSNRPKRRMTEAELFGSGVDLWTDEVDAAVKEVWKVRTRPPEFEPGDGFDAPV